MPVTYYKIAGKEWYGKIGKDGKKVRVTKLEYSKKYKAKGGGDPDEKELINAIITNYDNFCSEYINVNIVNDDDEKKQKYIDDYTKLKNAVQTLQTIYTNEGGRSDIYDSINKNTVFEISKAFDINSTAVPPLLTTVNNDKLKIFKSAGQIMRLRKYLNK